MSVSTKPYIVRALYEWCIDQGHTPYLMVWVNEHTQVPHEYVQDEQIVLNIGPNACQHLHIDNEWVSFEARFSGVSRQVWVPIGHVVSLYARETGEGLMFEITPYLGKNPDEKLEESLHLVEGEHDAEQVPHEETEGKQGKSGKGLKLLK